MCFIQEGGRGGGGGDGGVGVGVGVGGSGGISDWGSEGGELS